MNTIDSPMRRSEKKWSRQWDLKSQNILRRSSFWPNWSKGLTFGGQIQKLLFGRSIRTKKTNLLRRKMRVTQSNIKGIISIYAQCVSIVCRTISIKSSRLSQNSPILPSSISKSITKKRSVSRTTKSNSYRKKLSRKSNRTTPQW